MATRATIEIEGFDEAKIYKHWDGYPEAMLPWLREFHEDFLENRGWDPSYELAQCLRYACKNAKNFGLDDDPYLGWGIVGYHLTYGENYKYILKRDGSIEVQ
jgi:hypothetical protein